MSDDRPIIECRGVVKGFGAVEVLRGVDLTVTAGEFVSITGPSGGGKSTLLHLLGALDRPTAGELIVNGHDLARLRMVNRYRRHDVGIVFQLHNLLPQLSAATNVELAMFGSGLSHHLREERSAELLDRLGLGHARDRAPSRLSGGERQRVAIARALANHPLVLLADEPTGSLDAAASALVLDLLEAERRERGLTIVMVTHSMEAVDRAERRVQLVDGTVAPNPTPSLT